MKPLIVGINAKYIHSNNAIRLLKANSIHSIDIVDYTIKDDIILIYDEIRAKNPLFVGFSCYIWNIEVVKKIVGMIKKNTNIPVVLGGPEVSYDPDYFLKTMNVDIIVKGEGENVIDSIIDHYLTGTTLADTPSISTSTVNTPITEIENLDILKSPHFFPEDIPHIPNKIAYVESSRGCPYRCSYCISSLEKHVRFFSVSSVKNNLKYLFDNGVKTVKFLDRTFNANTQAPSIIDFIIAYAPENTSVQFEMTGDTLGEALIDHIHKHAPAGLFRFEIGIQSTNEKTNTLVGRHQNNNRLFDNIEKIINRGKIDLHLDLIAGLPEENLNRFKQTFNEVYNLGAKELQLGFLKMLRGTRIRNEAGKFNYHFDENAPYEIIRNDHLDEDDLATIRNVETALNIFHNKGYFNDTLLTIVLDNYKDYFDFFLRLYDHYAEDHPLKGYQIEDVYGGVHGFLMHEGIDNDTLDNLKMTYLRRSRIKPKGYFEKIHDKPLRTKLLSHCAKHHDIDLNTLYKHSLITPYKKGYAIALYTPDGPRIMQVEASKIGSGS